MNLIETLTGDKLEAEIVSMSKIELRKFEKHEHFIFDWSTESVNDVFKVKLKEGDEVLGMVSVIDIPGELRMHINLIEASKKYRGKNKPIQNIVGCLIAYVCKMSFKNGYEGFVSLTPKTKLVNYYKNYGFRPVGNQMAVFYEISNSIIQKYYGDEEI